MPVTEVRPVNERIAQELLSRLQLLTAGFSDYFTAPYAVRDLFHDTESPQNHGIVLTQSNDERLPEFDCPGNPPALAYQTTYNVRCRIMPSERDTTPVTEYCNVIAAEVQRVIVSPGTNSYQWHTMEDLAFDCDFGAYEFYTPDGAFDGISVPVIVSYRVSEGNAFEVRA